MSFKSLASAILVAVIITIIMPVQGSQDDESYQVLPIGNYNVYLDFAGKDITIKPVSASSSLDTITRSIMVQGSDDTDFAVVYLYEYTKSPGFDLEDRLWRLMKSFCTMTETDPATIANMDGFLGTGYARVKHGFGKQVCYGGIASLPSGAVAQRDFAILAHFNNKTLNEHLVKTAKIEYTGQMVKI